MLNLDPLLDTIDLVDLAQSAGAKLRKVGHGWQGSCPFHDGDGESFSIYADDDDRQRWHCFSVCDADGDALDFVARWQNLTEFMDQVRWLANYARIPLERLGWTPQAAAEHQAHLERAALLTRASAFYQRQLWADTDAARKALAYVRSRGLTDAHIKAAGWGLSMSDNALMRAMQGADHAAEYIKLAKEVGLIRRDGKDFTANCEGDQVSPDGWIVYPHARGSKVTYFSSRAVSEITKGSKARNLPGERQPYRVHTGIDGKPLHNTGLVIVEGPADAESCRAWGWPSVALCGCSVRESENPALLEYFRKRMSRGPVYIALSNDEAGHKGTETLAAAIDPMVKVVDWPKAPGKDKGDANDQLQAGTTAEGVQALFNNSVTWMQALLNTAERDRNPDTIRAVVEAYAQLDVFNQSMWKKTIVRGLDITVGDFDNMLRSVGAELEGDLDQNEYAVRGGMLCLAEYGKSGLRYKVLCNFNARIVRDVVEDDGEEQLRYFAISGKTATGRALPEFEIEADDFPRMNWVLGAWGAAAQVAAGSSTTDHLRAAIQSLSEDVRTKYVYSHLGWRKINGVHRYLSASGAVGLEDVQVRVINDLERYRMPDRIENLKAACEASLRFLETGNHLITIPLLAAMYLAPLASIVPPSFTIWLFGTTGSLKSTATALAMCHFGKFAYNTPPASWSGTTNALEKKAFLVKDAPLWIDDYTAQSTLSGMREMKRKSDQLLRDWGNRSGRSRMRADLKLRRTFVPRGLIISTAEQLPPGPSIIPRLFAIEIEPDSMTRGEGSELTNAQLNDADLYPHAMAGYLDWMSRRWDELAETLPPLHRDYTDRARNQASTHMRMPGNVATMMIGWDVALRYFADVGVISAEEHEFWRELGWGILVKVGDAQQSLVVDENPVQLYFEALEQMFAQGAIYLRHRTQEFGVEMGEEDLAWPKHRTPNSVHLGWHDDDYLYLLPTATCNEVKNFYRKGGKVFPDSTHGVTKKLGEADILVGSQRRDTYQIPLSSSYHPWVLRIKRPAIDFVSIDPPTKSGKSGNSGNSGNPDQEIPL